MANDLRDKGIQIANQAVEADNSQRYEEAIKGYIKAAEYLLTATKYEKNPVTLKTIRDKVRRAARFSAVAPPPIVAPLESCAARGTSAWSIQRGPSF